MRRVLLTLALAAGAGGCNRAETTRAPGRVVEVRIADYRYTPQSVSITRGRVTFAVTNAGREPTNFRVRRGETALASISTLDPGEYGTVTVDLRRGNYVMYSSVARNEALGEHGVLTVR